MKISRNYLTWHEPLVSVLVKQSLHGVLCKLRLSPLCQAKMCQRVSSKPRQLPSPQFYWTALFTNNTTNWAWAWARLSRENHQGFVSIQASAKMWEWQALTRTAHLGPVSIHCLPLPLSLTNRFAYSRVAVGKCRFSLGLREGVKWWGCVVLQEVTQNVAD